MSALGNRQRPWTAGALARLTACAGLLCAVGSAGVAMDLSEMPPWLRAMIQPVHLGAAAEVETVPVGAPGAPVPAVVVGAGAETVGVSAPGAAPISVGGGLSLEAWGTPGAGAVHAPGMGGPAGPAPVSISAAAQDWSEAVGSIEGLDRETLAQAGQILAMIRERGVAEGWWDVIQTSEEPCWDFITWTEPVCDGEIDSTVQGGTYTNVTFSRLCP